MNFIVVQTQSDKNTQEPLYQVARSIMGETPIYSTSLGICVNEPDILSNVLKRLYNVEKLSDEVK